jgi:FkbM family methyltransferase
MNLALYEFIKYRLRPIEFALIVTYLFRVKRFVHPAHNCKFWIDPVSGLGIRLLREGHYEQRTMHTITSYLSTGDICVDLGANEGYFSVLAAKKVGVTGRILSIEPQERLWQVWQKNCYLNDITNCQLVPYGISETMREVEFTLAPLMSSGFSSFVEGQSFLEADKLLRKLGAYIGRNKKLNFVPLMKFGSFII